MVAPQRAHHAGQRLAQHQQAACAWRDCYAVFIDHSRIHPGQRDAYRAGFGADANRCAQRGRAQLSLPPVVSDKAALAAVHQMLKRPFAGFRVHRLARHANKAQARQVTGGRKSRAKLHEHANGSRRGEHDIDALTLHHIPHCACIGVVWRAFTQHAGQPFQQRAVHDVRVPHNPADVGRGPKNIARFAVKKSAQVVASPHHVATVYVHHAFGLAGAAAGVQNVEWVFRINRYSFSVSWVCSEQFIEFIFTR